VNNHRLLHFLSSLTVISVGVAVLIGLSSDWGTPAADFAAFVLRLVTVIAAVAVFVGVFNLLAVHLGRLARSERGWPYSLLALLAGGRDRAAHP